MNRIVRMGLMLPFLVPIAGCRDSAPPPSGPGGPSGAEAAGRWQEELFSYAVDNLNRLEEFNSGEMLRQIVDRLNQWAATQPPPADWVLDPLVGTLPETLAEIDRVKGLEKLEFSRYDGFALQEAVWLRDLSNWTCGERLDDLSRARAMFDWTVRNIQLGPPGAGQVETGAELVAQMPWETLLLGRGTAMDRAWVFVLLARQQGIDAAVLALVDSGDPEGGLPQPWAVGILSDEKIYLFDPAFGVPIPAADGLELDDAGALEIQPATLQQVRADDALLRQLDFDTENPYPVEAADLDRVVALIEASPSYMSRRMTLLESRLAGKQKVVLTTDATAQAERWKAHPQVCDARLWTLPYAVALQQQQFSDVQKQQRFVATFPFMVGADAALWKGRVLHLKGVLVGERSATSFYQRARPSDRELQQLEAIYYQARSHPGAEPTDAKLPAEARAAEEQRLRQEATLRARQEMPFYVRAKQDASYWLGLVAFERKNDRSAIAYFLKRTLEASPGGPWTHGAKYNLGRCYEASGQGDKAVDAYLTDLTSPARFGNVLRARWLRAQRPATDLPETDLEVPEPEVEVPEPEIKTPQPATADEG